MSFESDAELVVRALERYREASASRAEPVVLQAPMADLERSLELERHAREGGLTGEALGVFLEVYLRNTTRLHHPAYMAHQVATPHPSGALGALIDGYTNNAMAIYEMGPAAATIEHFVVGWMLGLLPDYLSARRSGDVRYRLGRLFSPHKTALASSVLTAAD